MNIIKNIFTRRNKKTMRLAGLKHQDEGVNPITAVILMVAITISLASFLHGWAIKSASPEIYFHVEEEVTTDVTVEMEGGVTTTIPEVPMGKTATWKDVHVAKDGTITYNEKEYPFLYYEGVFSYHKSNFGWLVEKQGQNYILGGEEMNEAGILSHLMEEMVESGLLENEADYVIQRIVNLDMLETEKPYLSIHYIPMEDVNEAIELTTSFEFSQMRRHFVITGRDAPIPMTEPSYEPVEDTGYLIHETAVNYFTQGDWK